jgi:uncharacterized protein (DUF305 family)
MKDAHRRMLVGATLLMGLTCAAGAAQAQQMMHGSSMAMGASAPPADDASAATSAFKAADASMMKDMDSPYIGNADQDFVAHMLPHHEGAVAMAQIELKYGKDPQIKRLARNIIKAQKQEIAFMKKWQASQAQKAAK